MTDRPFQGEWQCPHWFIIITIIFKSWIEISEFSTGHDPTGHANRRTRIHKTPVGATLEIIGACGGACGLVEGSGCVFVVCFMYRSTHDDRSIREWRTKPLQCPITKGWVIKAKGISFQWNPPPCFFFNSTLFCSRMSRVLIYWLLFLWDCWETLTVFELSCIRHMAPKAWNLPIQLIDQEWHKNNISS